MKYYSLPFIIEKSPSAKFFKTNTEQSIRQHISLMLSSMPGSFRFSPMFGSWLNKQHYLLPDKKKGEKRLELELKEMLENNLRLQIGKYEPRLSLHDMDVVIKFPKESEIEPIHKGGRIIFEINLRGIINGRESFEYAESIFLK